MHELELMRSLLRTVEARAGGLEVVAVRLEVGRLRRVAPEALRSCFEVWATGGPLEGVVLDVIEIDAVARCRTCGQEGPIERPLPVCPCGSGDLELLSGDELRLKELEVV